MNDNTKVGPKLEKFFKRSGIQKKWFAERLDIAPKYFYQIVKGKFPMPKKYWEEVVDMTNGQITLGDLVEDFLGFDSALKVDDNGTYGHCSVSFKNRKKALCQ